ncbi:LegC family aminotransferase [Azonexus sp. R2A61]|uniref:LegC family aminotransferase n=1 Tax=Azonexus sp. R2A61 TaxID=2744443 RepID=UPI001F327B59|nr:LegC family aminotransferase [Azonexus sp. R2A61]
MSPFVESVVAAVRGVVGQGPVALHEPAFQGNEWAYVKECLDTGWVSSVGKFVDRFEHDLASYTGAGYAVAVVNGTAALQVALTVSGVRAGDEVLVPAMSFVATANAVWHAGAQPHFVDSDENTLGMSMPALEAHLDEVVEMREGKAFNRHTGRRLAAVVPMHTFGHPVDLSSLAAIADRYGLAVVEDAAESLGSYFDGRHTGTFGRCGVLSFNGNKIITTGGGGAILTDDAELARRAKHLTTTAKAPHRWSFSHDEIAFNYRLPNLNAALGCAQLEQVGAFLAGKRRLAERYETAFADLSGVTFVKERAGTQANYWLQTLLLDVDHAVYRDDLLAALNDAGFMSRPVWDLLSGLPPYRESPAAALSVAQSLAERIVNIPSSPGLADG